MSRLGLASAGRPPERTVILTAAAAFATLFCVAVPRIGPLVVVSLSLLAAIFVLASEIRRGEGRERISELVLRPESIFVAWVLAACLWAYAPLNALGEAVLLALFILHLMFLPRVLERVEAVQTQAIAQGILIGFLLAGVFVCYEIWMRDALVRFVLTYFPQLERGLARHGTIQDGQVVRMGGNISTRSSVVLVLLWCPAVLAAIRYTRGSVRLLSFLAIAAMSLIVILHPNTASQSAQLVLVVVAVTLGLALALPKLAPWLVGAGFACNLFLIVPASLALFHADMHLSPNLFRSGQARVIIWHYTAERVLENPLLGVGSNSTRYLDEDRVKRGEVKTPPGYVVAPQTRAHPHNIYLQIWYELGVIGALAFAVLGFSMLRRTGALSEPSRALALTHAAACMTVIVSTYGLWQAWFQATIVMSIGGFMLIARPAGDIKGPGHPQAAVHENVIINKG